MACTPMHHRRRRFQNPITTLLQKLVAIGDVNADLRKENGENEREKTVGTFEGGKERKNELEKVVMCM